MPMLPSPQIGWQLWIKELFVNWSDSDKVKPRLELILTEQVVSVRSTLTYSMSKNAISYLSFLRIVV